MSKQKRNRKQKAEKEEISTMYLVITIVLIIVLTQLIESVVVGFQISISGLGLFVIGLVVVLWWLRAR